MTFFVLTCSISTYWSRTVLWKWKAKFFSIKFTKRRLKLIVTGHLTQYFSLSSLVSYQKNQFLSWFKKCASTLNENLRFFTNVNWPSTAKGHVDYWWNADRRIVGHKHFVTQMKKDRLHCKYHYFLFIDMFWCFEKKKIQFWDWSKS